MPGPPTDIEPSALFRKLCETPAPSDIYDYPRKGVDMQFRMFKLGVDEHQDARERAHKKLEKKGYTAQSLDGVNMREIYGDMVARELIAMAVRGVDPIPGSENTPGGLQYPRHFPDAESLGKASVSADEVAVLFTMYQMTQAKYGPFDQTIENEHQLTKWMELLVQGASAAPLARCDWRALVESSMLLARRAYLLSAALESQRSSLPDTLVSTLDALGLGMCELGKLPAQLTDTGLGGNGDWVLFDVEELDALVTGDLADNVKEAARAAQVMHKHGD